jgi:hypothetical protein
VIVDLGAKLVRKKLFATLIEALQSSMYQEFAPVEFSGIALEKDGDSVRTGSEAQHMRRCGA